MTSTTPATINMRVLFGSVRRNAQSYVDSLKSEFTQATQKVSEANAQPDAKVAAAAQADLLSTYYKIAFRQSQVSFYLAAAMALGGFVLFAIALVLILFAGRDAAILGTIGGAVVELVSGLGFYLYGKATEQSNVHLARLGQVQRFLLAIQVAGTITEPQAKDSSLEKLTASLCGTPQS